MTLTVLAVDDSKTMRDLVQYSLAAEGFAVHVAVDGEDGLAQLGTLVPHVIITDINMPNLDGFGFIERVRGRSAFQGVPILVLTTESDPGLKQRARAAGATGWIVKPFAPDRLVAAIRRVAG